MKSNRRKYELKKRAERQDETRQRIVEATVALHEQLGPAQTSISAIAERAGVGRPTVYRHFPDERSLFTACTTHYHALHQPPDPTGWRQVADPEERMRTGLLEVYRWYRDTERMMPRFQLVTCPQLPVLAEVLEPQRAWFAEAHEVLADGWPAPAPLAVRAAIGLALAFSTWRLLARDHGLIDETAAESHDDTGRLLGAGGCSGPCAMTGGGHAQAIKRISQRDVDAGASRDARNGHKSVTLLKALLARSSGVGCWQPVQGDWQTTDASTPITNSSTPSSENRVAAIAGQYGRISLTEQGRARPTTPSSRRRCRSPETKPSPGRPGERPRPATRHCFKSEPYSDRWLERTPVWRAALFTAPEMLRNPWRSHRRCCADCPGHLSKCRCKAPAC